MRTSQKTYHLALVGLTTLLVLSSSHTALGQGRRGPGGPGGPGGGGRPGSSGGGGQRVPQSRSQADVTVVDEPFNSTAWQAEIKNGFVPYHKLVASDYAVNDSKPASVDAYTSAFMHYSFASTEASDGTATLTSVALRYGLNRNETWRRSKLSDPSVYLDHEQGHLDIAAIYAKRFAAELRSTHLMGRGPDAEAAKADLGHQIDRLLQHVTAENERQQSLYDCATGGGELPAPQKLWRSTISRQLAIDGIQARWVPTTAAAVAAIFTSPSCGPLLEYRSERYISL